MGEEVKVKKRKTPDARVYACALGEVFENGEQPQGYGLGDGGESIPFCFIVDN